jgi:hypothetical protein
MTQALYAHMNKKKSSSPEFKPQSHTKKKKKENTVCIHMYSAIKKNGIMVFIGKWMELENIMLRKVSQARKVKGCVFSVICGS